MILRQLISRIEKYNVTTREVRVPLLELPISDTVKKSVAKTAGILKDKILSNLPVLEGVKLISDDPVELLLNNTWKPSLTVIGGNGYPEMKVAGNVLRPFSNARITIRLPPSYSSSDALEMIEKALTENPPFSSDVKVENPTLIDGFVLDMPENDKLRPSLTNVSKVYFNGQDFAEMGCGGSIPFMKVLSDHFKSAKFIVTGVVNLDSNVHGPNESLNLTFTKKFICSLSHLISDYKAYL